MIRSRELSKHRITRQLNELLTHHKSDRSHSLVRVPETFGDSRHTKTGEKTRRRTKIVPIAVATINKDRWATIGLVSVQFAPFRMENIRIEKRSRPRAGTTEAEMNSDGTVQR